MGRSGVRPKDCCGILIDAINMGILHQLQELDIHHIRHYECPFCKGGDLMKGTLKEGLEIQFPPRMSYWSCVDCGKVFEESPAYVGEPGTDSRKLYGYYLLYVPRSDVEKTKTWYGPDRICDITKKNYDVMGFVRGPDGIKHYPIDCSGWVY